MVLSGSTMGFPGGSPIFRHTFNFFKRYGHDPQKVKLQFSLGKGKDWFWWNVFPSPLVNEFYQRHKEVRQSVETNQMD